jgi:hypothetical protein
MDAVQTSLAQNTSKLSGRRSITDWNNLVINKGQSNEDWKDAFQAARDFLNTSTLVNQLVFPAGIYQYSVSPNWAIQDAQIIAEGEVRLRYTGTGHAVILDGTVGANSNVYNMEFKGFIIEAPSTSIDGINIHAVHHSKIDVRVMGCGNIAVHVYFAVCTEFYVTVSGNEEGWYQNAKPFTGLYLEQKVSGQIPSYCVFYNPIIEGTTEGATIKGSLGNIFIGGTMEGCADTGLSLNAESGLNKFFGMDFESNGGNDITISGFQNEIHGCDSVKMVDFTATAKNNSLFGGNYKSITLESGSANNILTGITYNRELYDGTDGTIIDSGTNNRLSNNRNAKLNRMENRPPSSTAITVTASPFTYTNTTGNDETVHILGGTISTYQYVHASYGDVISNVPTFTRLCPGDSITIAYSVAPTMRKYTT